jgi:hypothetical protein
MANSKMIKENINKCLKIFSEIGVDRFSHKISEGSGDGKTFK